MAKHLRRDLEHLHQSVVRMAGCVEHAIYTAARALQARDPALARQVVDADSEIDHLENAIQVECLKILALHQPVAVDLRWVGTVMLISTDLERMGDLAVGLAERAELLAGVAEVPLPDRFLRMTERSTAMVRAALDAFDKLDATAARAVVRADDEVDADNDTLIDWLTDEMKRSPEWVQPGLWMFSAVRYVERIADHATNIAEDVVYLVEGQIIRHHPEALATALAAAQ